MASRVKLGLTAHQQIAGRVGQSVSSGQFPQKKQP
jgi:hypothetical protein